MDSLRTRQQEEYGFASTHWTTVRACVGSGEQVQAAREAICRDYWYPVYAYVRRLGHPGFDAGDLTQDFFAHILRRPWFEQADRTRGRFRSFLLGSLDQFIRDVLDGKRAIKRGGTYQHIPLDLADARSRQSDAATRSHSPAETYEAEWAMIVVDTAWRRLESEYTEAGKTLQFAVWKTFLTVEGDDSRHESAAQRLGTTVESVKAGVQRLRRRYGVILREEVARTVIDPDEIPGEIQHLRGAFAERLVSAAA